MPRASEEKMKKAYEMYANGTKLVDIAKELGVPPGTVRRWKSEKKWDGDNANKSERSEKKANVRKEIAKRDIESVMQNEELTDKQKLFCIHYVRCFSAAKAYLKAYDSNYSSACSHGYELLRKEPIKREIQRLKQNRLNIEIMDGEDIVQKYMDIAFADITDYVEFGNGTFTDPETEEEMPYTFVNLKDSKNVDGTIISEVSKGREGAKIKLNDRMKALEWLSNYFELNPSDNHKREFDKRKLEIELTKIEMQSKDVDVVEESTDNFLDALNRTAKEVWDDELE